MDTNRGSTNKNAQFISPTIKDSFSTCQMTFWYQIYGKDIGAIEVYSLAGSQKSRITKLVEQTNTMWKQGTVFIGRYRSDFMIYIEGYISSNVNGHIALDDIQFISITKIISKFKD